MLGSLLLSPSQQLWCAPFSVSIDQAPEIRTDDGISDAIRFHYQDSLAVPGLADITSWCVGTREGGLGD